MDVMRELTDAATQAGAKNERTDEKQGSVQYSASVRLFTRLHATLRFGPPCVDGRREETYLVQHHQHELVHFVECIRCLVRTETKEDLEAAVHVET
jgi:hypothetical protein